MDESLLLFVNGLRSPAGDAFVKPLDDWGIYLFLALPLLLLIVQAARGRRGAELFRLARSARDGMLSWFLAFLLSEAILKPIIERPRPTALAHLRRALKVLGRVPSPTSLSFPSGTAAVCFAVAAFLWARFGPKVGLPAALLAALIGACRLYIGVHYPTDVLAGAIFGALLGWSLSWLGGRLDRGPSLAPAPAPARAPAPDREPEDEEE